MPLPTSSFGAPKPASKPEEPAYLCPNVRCRYRAYQRLPECPQCGRVGNFVPESFVKTWNVLAGLMFVMIGLMLTVMGLFFIVGVASGRLTNGSHGWWVNLMLPAIAAIFILGGISTVKGHSWFVWLLLLLRR
jgi:hypothetical protein